LDSESAVAQARHASPARRSVWAWARILGGAGILVLLVWQVGTGPFLDGVRRVDGSALVAALAIGALATVCAAWRWRLIANGLGVRLPLGGAVAAYYRSQFLNTTLPGGLIGDVHRAVRHGLDIGDLRLGVRAVILERLAGQTVHVVVAMLVLLALPSPVRAYMPAAVAITAAVALCAWILARVLGRGDSSRLARALRTARSDLREALVAQGAWAGVLAGSAVVLAGHLATFVLAARTAGATAPLPQLLPLIVLATLAMGLPLNIAGWGPREGAAAWAFGAAGLTSTQGVAAAVTYGVLVFAASLPGALVLLIPKAAQSTVPAFNPGGTGG
jgi:glycosyltransferase 2 family protein